MRRLLLFAVLALAVSTVGAHHAATSTTDSVRVASLREPPRRPAYLPGQVLVKFREAAPRGVEEALREAGGVRARRSAFEESYKVELDADTSVAEAIDRLRARPEVEYAEPNGRVHAFLHPNDRLFPAQWHFRMLNVERTWDIQQGTPSVIVAVLDTGIAYEDFGPFRKAPDWGGTVFVEGFNVYDGSTHANDDNFHGTHVASTVAEATNNGVGVAGLAFGCALMPVKVLDAAGEGSFFEVAEGIRHTVDFNRRNPSGPQVKVINLSLGGEGFGRNLADAVNAAVGAGIVVVAAAGNEGRVGVSFPASLPNVISVGAVDGRKVRAPYSSFGPELSVVAPGGDLARDDDGDGRPDGVLQQTFDPDTAAREHRFDDFAFFFVTGTSQSTPHVSALAGLLVQQGITDPAAVKAAIESTAQDLGPAGRDDEYGHGLIRPVEALSGLGLNR